MGNKVNIKQLRFPAYFKSGSTYTALLNEREYKQVRMGRNDTTITRGKNVHVIAEVLEHSASSMDVFKAVVATAAERINGVAQNN
jgi:hypothetical protein